MTLKIRSDAETDGKEEGRRLGLDEAREELSSRRKGFRQKGNRN